MQWQVLDARLPRPRHADPDRRPEAGDLRVPRRRRRHLPAGRAARPAPARTLGTNRRSDAALVDTLNATLRNAGLGTRDIVVRAGRGAHAGLPAGRRAAPGAVPARVARRDDFSAGRTARPHRRARERIANDLADDVGRLLDSDATCDGEPVEAHHVAVLVADRHQGGWSRRRSRRRGVPAVLNGGGDVFAHPGGRRLAGPAQGARAAAPRAAGAGGRAHLLLRRDAAAARRRRRRHDRRGRRRAAGLVRPRAHPGVAALVESLEERGSPSRVLGQVGGERLLTDLRHLGQLLHQTARRSGSA